MLDGSRQVSRRGFLYGSAALAGSATLAACTSGGGSSTGSTGSSGGAAGSAKKGSASKPLATPKKFSEATSLKNKGLPPVEQRLPENPYVVPHNWVERGKYGGKINMIVFSSQGAVKADSNREFFYGHSLLRWLNDGLDVGPGLVEKWSSNADASEWILHFRKGMKWSDGHPFTTEDVLFWWEDIVLPGHDAQSPPDDCRSGTGSLVKMSAIDDTTMRMRFDAPAPLFADRLATYVNGGIGANGAIWVLPKHYCKQFHPKYNRKVPKNWDTVGGLWESKTDWARNPDCPTMTGFRTKSFDNNKGVVLERNPYYWAVTKDGDQLPYLDEIAIDVIQDAQVGKLRVQQGNVDFCMGYFNQISVSDVSALMQNRERAHTDVLLWDSGSGTGPCFFLNYDYPDPQLRKLFREPKFRQAISHAFDRKTARKSLWFQTGELTTGTLSPKAKEYHSSSVGKSMYKQWRDAYVKHDPAKAKQLLAELGLKDADGDGYVELPGGKKLTIRIDYSADMDQTYSANDDQMVRDCKEIGLKVTRNPVSPQSYGDLWSAGKLMAHTNWECSDAANHLVRAPWLVPLESSRWAPLEGAMYSVKGTPDEHSQQDVDPWKRTPPRLEPEAGGPIAKLWKLYSQAQLEPDELKRTKLVFEMVKVHITDGPFFMGTVANFPEVIVTKTDLGNVPRRENLAQGGFVNPWNHPTPAVYDPETFFWSDPAAHNA
jgi:peptide/nickel transport system substrate-binding protein